MAVHEPVAEKPPYSQGERDTVKAVAARPGPAPCAPEDVELIPLFDDQPVCWSRRRTRLPGRTP
jgi:hypothetical protein